MRSIGIIGSGIAGLTLAQTLRKHANITVFEKSRGVGGRIATRRAGPYTFDHGAQFFKVRDAQFQTFLEPLIAANIIQPWCGTFAEITDTNMTLKRQWCAAFPHYVGTPSMNSMAKKLAEGLKIRRCIQIEQLDYTDEKQWRLIDKNNIEQGVFDQVILAIPPQQALALLPKSHAWKAILREKKMQSCFSLMIGLKHHHPLPFDAAVIKQRKISWIASNDSKPGREQNGSLTVHASNNWSDHNLEEHPENIKKILLQETCDVINIKKEAIQHLDLHQWRYANCKPQSAPPYWFSENEQLGMCGDWCIQGRIESAFTSAHKLAQNWMALYA